MKQAPLYKLIFSLTDTGSVVVVSFVVFWFTVLPKADRFYAPLPFLLLDDTFTSRPVSDDRPRRYRAGSGALDNGLGFQEKER